MAVDPVTAEKVASGILKAINIINGTVSEDDKNSKAPAVISIAVILIILILFLAPLTILSSPIASLFMFIKNPIGFMEFRNDYKKVVELPVVQTETISKYPLPCLTSEVTSGYGSRIHPVLGVNAMHTGYDFNTDWHSPVVAIADGEVEKIGIDKDYGMYMLLKNNDGFYTFYGHLSKTKALPHQEVKPFDVIGYEGGDPELDDLPGLSTGHHLHFEIRTNASAGSHTDPYPYILEPPPPPEPEPEKEKAQEKEVT